MTTGPKLLGMIAATALALADGACSGTRPALDVAALDLPTPDLPASGGEALPPRESGMGECDGLGNMLHLSYPVRGIDLTATELSLEKAGGGFIAIKGTSTSGMKLWLGRDGDVGDGAFDGARSYDAGRYPYHMVLQLWPASSGSGCEGNAQCETFFGLNGTWLVRSVTAPAGGTFTFSAITSQESCWAEQPSGPPDLKGCTIIGGTIFGCFKVN